VVTGIACLVLFKAREHPQSTVVVTTVCAVVTGGLECAAPPARIRRMGCFDNGVPDVT